MEILPAIPTASNLALASFTVSAIFWLIRGHRREIRSLTTDFLKAIETVSSDSKASLENAQIDNRVNAGKTYDLAGKTIQVLEHVLSKVDQIHKYAELIPEIREILRGKLLETSEHKPVKP